MKNPTRMIDGHLKGEEFSIYGLVGQPYHAHIVEHWCRRFFHQLQRVGDAGPNGDPFDEELLAVYLDVSTAISHLPDEEKEAVGYLTEGYSLYGKDNIANQLKIDDRTLRRRIRSAMRHISEELRD